MENNFRKFLDRDIWKEVILNAPFSERYQVFVSNYGQIKRIDRMSNKEIHLIQNKTEGYPSVNMRITKPLSEKESANFDLIRINLLEKERTIKSLQKDLVRSQITVIHTDMGNVIERRYEENLEIISFKSKIEVLIAELEIAKKKYKKKYLKCEKARKLNWGGLVHRFVAQAFVDKPSENHNLVAHLDYDKENNHFANLKWMTREESKIHQKSSPFVIESKAKVLLNGGHRGNSKLTEKQVMIIKKRINEGVSLRELSKRNKVTETQLLRIKRGINWGKVPAAL
jgi:NUMOD4 motif